MNKNYYEIGKTYILAFVGDGKVECYESVFEKQNGKLYGQFKCGIDVRIDNPIDKEFIQYFNITNSKLNRLINCSLFVFSNKETMKEILPKMVKINIDEMKYKSEAILKEYMKIADDCSSLENAIDSIKKNNFELIKTL